MSEDPIANALKKFIVEAMGSYDSDPGLLPESNIDVCVDRAIHQAPESAQLAMETDYLDFEDIARNLLSRQPEAIKSLHLASEVAQSSLPGDSAGVQENAQKKADDRPAPPPIWN